MACRPADPAGWGPWGLLNAETTSFINGEITGYFYGSRHSRNGINTYDWYYKSAWWFGTFFMTFPYIGNNHPN